MLLTNREPNAWSVAVTTLTESVAVFCKDLAHGCYVIGHSALSVVGLTTLTALTLCLGDERVRHELEVTAYSWLQGRSELRALDSGDTLSGRAEKDAVARATAADPSQLPTSQARLANWISKRYKVAPEPVAALVREAWDAGQRARLDPTLILAMVAIESRFNPFAQSHMGAQGLMQVMTQVHDDKFESFGGTHAAFDPVSNLRVGVQVLRESIARGGSVEEGLRHYVGAALLQDDGGYIAKVGSEQRHMRAVLEGRHVPLNASLSTQPSVRAPREASGTDNSPAPTDDNNTSKVGPAGATAASGQVALLN